MTRNFCSSMNSSQIRHENSQEKTQKTLLPVDSTPSGLSFLVTMTTWVGRSMKMCQESLVRSVITRQKLLLGSMNRKLSHLIDTPRSNEPLVIILAKSTLQPSKLPLPSPTLFLISLERPPTFLASFLVRSTKTPTSVSRVTSLSS